MWYYRDASIFIWLWCTLCPLTKHERCTTKFTRQIKSIAIWKARLKASHRFDCYICEKYLQHTCFKPYFIRSVSNMPNKTLYKKAGKPQTRKVNEWCKTSYKKRAWPKLNQPKWMDELHVTCMQLNMCSTSYCVDWFVYISSAWCWAAFFVFSLHQTGNCIKFLFIIVSSYFVLFTCSLCNNICVYLWQSDNL